MVVKILRGCTDLELRRLTEFLKEEKKGRPTSINSMKEALECLNRTFLLEHPVNVEKFFGEYRVLPAPGFIKVMNL